MNQHGPHWTLLNPISPLSKSQSLLPSVLKKSWLITGRAGIFRVVIAKSLFSWYCTYSRLPNRIVRPASGFFVIRAR